MTGPAVDVVDVAKSFGRTVALDGVSFRTKPGVTGLLGPNGAGKTTLLRILATVLAPDAGRVRLLGLDATRPGERIDIRRRLGYVPQDVGLYPTFSPFEFVDYVAILKEMADRRARHDEVRRVLDLVGLSEQAHQRIRTLSGGMRRRVGLAQALLGSPELLILDEPTAGLDPEQRLRFREVLSQTAATHAVILSTHQTEDVAALCERVVVLHRGAVRFDGPTTGLADMARGRVWLSDRRDDGATLAWRGADGRFRNIGDAPSSASPVDPSIEDGYLVLVGEQEAPSAVSA